MKKLLNRSHYQHHLNFKKKIIKFLINKKKNKFKKKIYQNLRKNNKKEIMNKN